MKLTGAFPTLCVLLPLVFSEVAATSRRPALAARQGGAKVTANGTVAGKGATAAGAANNAAAGNAAAAKGAAAGNAAATNNAAGNAAAANNAAAGNAAANNAGNAANATVNDANAQTSLTLDSKVLCTACASDGLAGAEAGTAASLTSTNNFINFCIDKGTITNGAQVVGGSCNPIPMGQIPAKTSMPSSKFQFPVNGQDLAANQAFTVKMAIQGLNTGDFTNAKTTYYAAPQQLDAQGVIKGHSHVVIQKVASFTDTQIADPTVFDFFLGLNAPAQGGILTADVAKGLPAGVYRLASINTSGNHVPALAPVAQHGSLDDMVYFSVGGGNAAANNAGAANNNAGAANNNAGAANNNAGAANNNAGAANNNAGAANNNAGAANNNAGAANNNAGAANNNAGAANNNANANNAGTANNANNAGTNNVASGTNNAGTNNANNAGANNANNAGANNAGANRGGANRDGRGGRGGNRTGGNRNGGRRGGNKGANNSGANNTGANNTGANNAGANNANNANNNNGANAANATANNADAQTSLTLDSKVLCTACATDGLAGAEAGTAASLTSTNNFINFCIDKGTITNGAQVVGGSCNPIPMGQIPAKTSMPSSKFQFPVNGQDLAANQAFTVKMAIQGLNTGDFTNAKTTYYAAPQQLDAQGVIKGHSHVVIQKVASFTDTQIADPTVFDFFLGLNAPAQGGILTADVAKGLPAGVYRLASINTSGNHVPALAPVAQHGSLDDMVYFSVGGAAQNAFNGNGANSTAAAGAAGAANGAGAAGAAGAANGANGAAGAKGAGAAGAGAANGAGAKGAAGATNGAGAKGAGATNGAGAKGAGATANGAGAKGATGKGATTTTKGTKGTNNRRRSFF